MTALPIDSLLPEISQSLQSAPRLVLAAPPGAGKTTRVPLALAGLIDGFEALPGKILLLEPRRIAARMAAERMASTLGERVGARIGLSTRVDRRVSDKTVVEVLTDGLFTRRLLQDPELTGVSAIIFDEVHERGLNTDLGLALALEAQAAFREDLRLIVMSATLDTETVAKQLNAPVLQSEGRQYPVETRYLGRTRDRIEDQMAAAIKRALGATDGSILAFLPGAGEIRRTAERLDDLPEEIILAPLYGALSPKDQDLAISPAPKGARKIVLATDIAESALTIEGVSTVVDSGLARVPAYDPASSSVTLSTVRAARANVDQRRGRAGRLGPGVCYRLWDEAETRGLTAAPAPEILNADLSGLVLTLADWGEPDAGNLTWLTKPPEGRLKAARSLLKTLAALDEDGRLNEKGRAMAELPLPPRFAALVAGVGNEGERALAAQIAALAGEQGVGGTSADLNERLTRFAKETSQRARALKHQADRWAKGAAPSGHAAEILAKAWPDRIARRRNPGSTSYLLASGRAGQVDEASPLARHDWLVVVDLVGAAKQGRITLAAPLREDLALKYGKPFKREDAIFDADTKQFKARRVEALGAIILSEQPLPKPSGAAARDAFLKHLEADGFEPSGLLRPIQVFLKRLAVLREAVSEDWPDWALEDLQTTVRDWLGDHLNDRSFQLPSSGTILQALKAKLGWPLAGEVDTLAPLKLALPSGRQVSLDWLDERAPLAECKPQELYGLTAHPSVASERVPVTLQLLSPGGKPVATTQDLPGFWAGGYHDMAKDMRGRYPKHDWPEDPARAKPHAGMTKARLAKG